MLAISVANSSVAPRNRWALQIEMRYGDVFCPWCSIRAAAWILSVLEERRSCSGRFRLPGGRQSGSILGRHHTIHSQKAGAGLGRLSGDHIVGGMRGLPHRAIALRQVRVPPRVASKIVAPCCEGRPEAVRGFPRFESCRDLVLKFPDGF